MSCAAKSSNARTAPGCIHLPVAARANTRRRFGEPETPGRALGPKDVAQWVDRVLADAAPLSAAVVVGPGEPLAEPAPVLETLQAVHAAHPQLPLQLVTNGLPAADADISALAAELAAAGLSKVTVLVDGVDPVIVEQIFAWIRPGKRTLPLPEASRLLVDAQARAIRAFREAGLYVAARMTIYSGINDAHVEDVANAVAALGADLLELAAYAPVSTLAAPAPTPLAVSCTPAECASCATSKSCGSKAPAAPPVEAPEAEPLPALAEGRLEELRALAARYIPLAAECDSCGDILWMEHAGASATLGVGGAALPKPSGSRVNVAVASSDGMDVDLHLGQAIKFLIFGPREGDGLPSLLGTREAPEPGGGDARWITLSETLHDCFALLAASAGAHPREVLAGKGLTVFTTESDIRGAVDLLFGGGKKNGKKRIKAN